jgi:hypothetical protein
MSGQAALEAQAVPDVSKLVTKADVEKVTGETFKDGWAPMEGELMFQQPEGDLQVSVSVEARAADKSVRSWEATIKKMEPGAKVEAISGVGSYAFYFSPREDNGALSADVETPRLELRVAIAGAPTPERARQVVVDLARLIATRLP